ncbi:MAG: glucosamine-6-phosphate deaminase [Saccharofermentanales bacterium]
MRIIAVKDAGQMGLEAARLMAGVVREKPEAVLGLATGSTPLGTYAELARLCAREGLDFSKITSFNLDEYIGLDRDHPQSYFAYMKEHFVDLVNIAPENVFLPDGVAEDLEAECHEYDRLLESYGFADLQLLGIGTNGHIAFNEPDDHFVAATHKVALTAETIQANQRFFDRLEDVPTHAITLGMRGIMSARQLVLIASGSGKARAIADACFGPVTPKVPASIIQLHANAVVIADREALALTELAGQV